VEDGTVKAAFYICERIVVCRSCTGQPEMKPSDMLRLIRQIRTYKQAKNGKIQLVSSQTATPDRRVARSQQKHGVRFTYCKYSQWQFI
jgi:hypothetical protein